MEGKSGVTVVGSDAPSNYQVAQRTTHDNINPSPSNHVNVVTTTITTSQVVGVSQTPAAEVVKKKRGRPRKYAPDGSVNVLSPKPISTAAPLPPVIDFSLEKRGKIRHVELVSKVNPTPIQHQQPKVDAPRQHQQPRVDLDTSGQWVSCSVGANFTPHIITVNTGEDVTMKIISFSQQGPRAICILSANGVVSSVTLRQPDTSGGTLTYEGRFEILSLTGSFMPSESGGMRNRSGGMSVSLASPDGRVVGGGVAGLLVAATPVQSETVPQNMKRSKLPRYMIISCSNNDVWPSIFIDVNQIVIGSFLAGDQHEQTSKKNKPEPVIAAVPLPTTEDDPYHSSVRPTMSTSSSFRVENWSATAPDSRNKPPEINVTLPS